MIMLKKWAKHKVNHIYCVNQFLREKHHTNETKNVNKNSLFCSFFVIFLIFWPLELKKPPVFKPDFYIFSFNEQLWKI